MKIEKIYVINLKTSNDAIWQKLRDLNIEPTECFILDAINGKEVVEGKTSPPFKYKVANWWKNDSNNSFHNRELTPSEIGCMLSHYQCVKEAYDGGLNNCLILEENFISTNSFPTKEMFSELPVDWSMIYLSRTANNPDLETDVSDNIVNAHYSYGCTAYMLSRKGMEEVLSSPILNNLIPADEFYSALSGTHDRKDAISVFSNKPGFKQYSFKRDYVNKAPKLKGSTSASKPKWLNDELVRESKQEVDVTPLYNESKPSPPTFKSVMPKPIESKSTVDFRPILNANDWEAWSKKYVNPLLMSGQYDLITDEPAPHVYVFPLFTKLFCEQLIALSETVKWTNGRHEFHPTTDNLLNVLGMKDIYNRVINDYIRPYAIDRFKLDGKDWDVLRDESFIIKYPHDAQSHLSVHHDFSNITTLVNLNPGEFEGGGTYFPKYKVNVNPKEVGVATLHPGNITHKHGARPVTKGTRYVVVSFMTGASHK